MSWALCPAPTHPSARAPCPRPGSSLYCGLRPSGGEVSKESTEMLGFLHLITMKCEVLKTSVVFRILMTSTQNHVNILQIFTLKCTLLSAMRLLLKSAVKIISSLCCVSMDDDSFLLRLSANCLFISCPSWPQHRETFCYYLRG